MRETTAPGAQNQSKRSLAIRNEHVATIQPTVEPLLTCNRKIAGLLPVPAGLHHISCERGLGSPCPQTMSSTHPIDANDTASAIAPRGRSCTAPISKSDFRDHPANHPPPGKHTSAGQKQQIWTAI